MKRNALVRILAASITAAILPLIAHGSAAARDYLIAGTKPNLLFLVDPQARKVVGQYRIPGDGPPATICTSPDGRIAYVLTAHGSAVSGIDLDTGKQIFRAEFSTPDLRVRSLAMTLSRDGKELFVPELPTKLLPAEYQVQEPRIAVYQTDGGLNAAPVRSFPMPRRVSVLLPSADGKIIYALGWDLYAFDARTGQLLKTYKVFHWDRPHSGPPDLLNAWTVYEQSEIFAAPYAYSRTDLPPESPDAHKSGLLTLDLRSGEMRMTDFENTSVVIFSAVINPKDPSQAYAVFTTLSRISIGRQPGLEKRVFLDHTYYIINISQDGNECYVGGTLNDIGLYSTRTMEKLGAITLPGGGDMALSAMRIVRRP